MTKRSLPSQGGTFLRNEDGELTRGGDTEDVPVDAPEDGPAPRPASRKTKPKADKEA